MSGMDTKRIVRAGFIALVLLQVVLLMGIIYTKHTWIRQGQKVLLRTVPVDPRSFMRGDYVHLDYEIDNINLDLVTNTSGFVRGEYVYITLAPDGKGAFEARGIYHLPPKEGMPFIKGRVKYSGEATRKEVTVILSSGQRMELNETRREWMYNDDDKGQKVELCLDKTRGSVMRVYYINDSDKRERRCLDAWRSVTGCIESIRSFKYPRVTVDYTIDSYFVEEGAGHEIERARNRGDVLVEAALREDGMPLISALIVDGKRLK